MYRDEGHLFASLLNTITVKFYWLLVKNVKEMNFMARGYIVHQMGYQKWYKSHQKGQKRQSKEELLLFMTTTLLFMSRILKKFSKNINTDKSSSKTAPNTASRMKFSPPFHPNQQSEIFCPNNTISINKFVAQ